MPEQNAFRSPRYAKTVFEEGLEAQKQGIASAYVGDFWAETPAKDRAGVFGVSEETCFCIFRTVHSEETSVLRRKITRYVMRDTRTGDVVTYIVGPCLMKNLPPK